MTLFTDPIDWAKGRAGDGPAVWIGMLMHVVCFVVLLFQVPSAFIPFLILGGLTPIAYLVALRKVLLKLGELTRDPEIR